jgi:hypothetical protein
MLGEGFEVEAKSSVKHCDLVRAESEPRQGHLGTYVLRIRCHLSKKSWQEGWTQHRKVSGF